MATVHLIAHVIRQQLKVNEEQFAGLRDCPISRDDYAKPAPIIDQQGAAGWDTTGIAWTAADGTTLLMKRPR